MKRLTELKDKFKGERIFIIGNGPSLNEIDIKKLSNEYTFSFNRAYIAYNKWGFIPSFYSVVDKIVLPDNREEINERINDPEFKKTLFFFPSWSENILNKSKNIFFLEDKSYLQYFDENLRRFVVLGNVGATSIQIAVYLGFKNIVLLGCDANYVEKPNGVEVDKEESERVGWTAYRSTNNDDPNHFVPNYFGKGKSYSIPQAKKHIKGWSEVKKWLDVYNSQNKEKIVLVNSSPGSKINFFNKTDFEDLFNTSTKKKVFENENQNNMNTEKKEKIVVFGTDRTARLFLDKNYNNYMIEYFVDNDKKKWNELLYNKLIRNPNVLFKEKYLGKVFVCVTNGEKILKNQLSKLGVFDNCFFIKADA